MRAYPTTYQEFKTKHGLNNEDLSFEKIENFYYGSIVFRHDLAFINLLQNLKNILEIDDQVDINEKAEDFFAKSDRIITWEKFQKNSDLDIPDLRRKIPKSLSILAILSIPFVLALFIYYSFFNMDTSIFSLLHSELMYYLIIAVLIFSFALIFGINKFLNPRKDELPFTIPDISLEEALGKIILLNKEVLKDSIELLNVEVKTIISK